VEGLRLPIEDLAKTPDTDRRHFLYLRSGAGKALDRRHLDPRHTAGDDAGEVGEIGGDIESESVGRNPSADVDTQGSDLAAFAPDPDLRLLVPSLGGEPESLESSYQDFLQIMHVSTDVTPIGIEIDNGIAHQLTGSVVGNLTATVGLGDSDAVGCQPLGAGQNLAPVGASTQGIGVGMLQEDQPLAGTTLSQQLAGVFLELEGSIVGDPTEIGPLQNATSLFGS
jgi:hypothetical protein